MTIVQERNIKLWNIVSDGVYLKTSQGDGDMGFISATTELSTIDEMIEELKHALSGNFDLITNPDIYTPYGDVAFITAKGIEYRGMDAQNKTSSFCSLKDFHEMLVAWRDFLLTPPLHGSKVRNQNL